MVRWMYVPQAAPTILMQVVIMHGNDSRGLTPSADPFRALIHACSLSPSLVGACEHGHKRDLLHPLERPILRVAFLTAFCVIMMHLRLHLAFSLAEPSLSAVMMTTGNRGVCGGSRGGGGRAPCAAQRSARPDHSLEDQAEGIYRSRFAAPEFDTTQ